MYLSQVKILLFITFQLLLNKSVSQNYHETIIKIHNSSNFHTITDQPFLFKLNDSMLNFEDYNNDGSNLRIFDCSDSTDLNYWIETWGNNTANIWVKIDEINKKDEITVCFVPCNNSENTNNEGKKIFELFDSFENYYQPIKNATLPLNIPTYDGSGQAVHPDIFYIPEKWNGYKYWMTITPYPNSSCNYENPSIIVSNDGIKWEEPNGIRNPIVQEPDGWNNDPDMLLVDDKMILYFNESNNNKKTYVKRTTSTDGINWSNAETVIEVPWHLMSPTILFEDSTYYMWYMRSPKGCRSTYQNVTLRESKDGLNWEKELQVNIPINGRAVWHFDIQKEGSEYVMILASYAKNSDCLNTSLFFAKSKDKINWDVNPTPILNRAPSESAWDNKEIYRSTFILEENYLRLWYSGSDNYLDWHIGYVEDELTNYFKQKIWNEVEGSIRVDYEKSHSGELGITQLSMSGLTQPKLIKSVSKEGVYNIWMYDEMKQNSSIESMFFIGDNNNEKVGLGINQKFSKYKYSFVDGLGKFFETNIYRTKGWHKVSIHLQSELIDLYIDDQYVSTEYSLDERNIIFVSLESANEGKSWFDDFYYFNEPEELPKIIQTKSNLHAVLRK